MTSPSHLKGLNARLRRNWELFARNDGSSEAGISLRQTIRDIASEADTLSLSALCIQARHAERQLLDLSGNGFPLRASELSTLHDQIIGLKQLSALLDTGAQSQALFADTTPLVSACPHDSPCRILIVDDDPALLAAYEQVLTRARMSVLGISDPFRTMEAAAESDPDVIVLDVTLSAVSGLELATLLRKERRHLHTPILFLSNEDDYGRRLQALSLGADDFLIKPVSPEHLVAAVSARAQRARRTRQLDTRLRQTLYQLEREHTALDQHAIVSIADRHGNITYVNDRFCKISGYSREELLGQNHRIVRSAKHEPEFYRTLWHTITTGRVWTGEICNSRKDGSHYWVASTITPFMDERGRPYQYVSIRTDITVVKESEETLRTEGELHEVINRIAASLLSTDSRTLSSTMKEMLGKVRSTLGTDAAFVSLIHDHALADEYSQTWSTPESRQHLGQRLCEATRSLRSTGRPLILNANTADSPAPRSLHRVVEEEGIRSLLLIPLGQQKECRGHICLVDFSRTDPWGSREVRVLQLLAGLVSQAIIRMRAEETVRSHKEIMRRGQVFANIGTWEWNIVTDELYWTERIAPLFGYPEGELQTSYDNFIQAIHPEDRQLVADRITACLDDDELYEVEHRVVWPDGTVRWLMERGDVVRTPDGRPLRMIGVVQDIDARKQAEKQLVEARKDAERANEAKSDFLSSMSHELRTPMNVILGFAQLLEYDDTLTHDQRDSTREITRAGHHLLELINDVLDLAKVESGAVRVSLEHVEVAPLIRECLLQMAPIAEDHGITLTPFTGPDARACADYTRLRQVLLNLISNAIKYNRTAGQVTVHTGFHEVYGHLFIQVTDTGHGLDREQITRLFQPFERLHAQNTGTEGTGIGLNITRRLMELMNGTIEVESEPGCGSTFQVNLPGIVEPDVSVTPTDEMPPDSGWPVAVPRKQILYVEDNPSNIKLLQQILATHTDTELLVAPSAGLAVEMALSRPPDLILLDINMPFMDGYQVLSLLRESSLPSETPIIALTANTTERDVERGLKAGFDDYLTKPLDIEKLIEVLRHHLNG